MLDVNTVSKHPTHFLRAIELIKKAREKYNVPSENWPNPTDYKFGIPNTDYYAEVFVDGMDWQPSYWVIEEKELNKPKIQPFIIFKMNEDRRKFNDFDFEELINACLYYRADKFWFKNKDLSYYTDTIWPFLFLQEDIIDFGTTKLYTFEHASQKPVSFSLNVNFIPEAYREYNWHDRNKKKKHFNCVPEGPREV